MRVISFRLSAALAPILAASTPLAAQIPDGHFAMSSAQAQPLCCGPWAGVGGIYVGHPRVPGGMQPVQGLPRSLTGAGFRAFRGGNSIEIDPETGELILGEVAFIGQTVHVHRISLSGLNVADIQSLGVGVSTSPERGDVAQTAALPGRRVLIGGYSVRGRIGAGGLTNLAVADFEAGTVTALFPTWTATTAASTVNKLNALCADVARGTGYLGVHDNVSQSQIYSFPLSLATPPTLLAAVPGRVSQLAVDANGDLIVAYWNAVASISRVSRSGASVTPLLTGFNQVNALAIEPATGAFIIVANDFLTSGVWYYDPAAGTRPQFLTNTATGGHAVGIGTGLVCAPAPTHYGAPSGPDVFPWSQAPRAGGLPLLGEQRFQIGLDNPGGVPVTAAAWWMAAGPASLPTPFGVTLLVLPASFFTAPFGPGLTQRVPIPANPALLGGQLYTQGFVLNASGLSASDGLRITIL